MCSNGNSQAVTTVRLSTAMPSAHDVRQRNEMITIKQLENDLIAMEKQGLVKKAGYEYNRAEVPEQRYELTQAGNAKCWAYELGQRCDGDKATLGGSGYE